MSGVLDEHGLLDFPSLAVDRPLAHTVDLDDEGEAFQAWEIHSELVLVSPELRQRSLELLPPPPDVLARRPRTLVLAAPAPVPAFVPDAEPEVREIGALRYTAHRVADVARFGFAIIGVIFTLAMIAEVLPH
jgi:hypothetical protein